MGSIGPNVLEIQIINDAQKTVKFYENSSGVYNKLIATSTWQEVTLPYLTTDNKAVHFTFPQSVFDAAYIFIGEDNREFYVTQQNGYLRQVITVDEDPNDESVFFNATANTSITNATIGYTNPLVGTWKLDDTDTFIFSDNNTFTHVKTVNDDDNCQSGSATGTYSWNPLTFALNVELQTDSTAVEADDSCSIRKSKLTPNGNTIVLYDREDNKDYTFTKVTSSTGLVGTWVGGTPDDYTILFFTGTQYFISDYHEDNDGYGTESGTYIYNTGTSQFTPSVLKDNNGYAGFSNNQQTPLVIAGDNNSFTVGDGFFTVGDSVVFKRLK